MKMNFLAITAVAAMAAMTMSCGNKTAQNENRTDSVKADTTTVEAAAEQQDETEQAPVLTAKGLGKITLGMSFKDLPKSVEGLYTRFEEISNDDFEGIYLYAEGDKEVAVLEGDGKVQSITVNGGDVKTANGIGFGMPAGDLKKINGLKKVAADPQADFPLEQYISEGVTITIDSYVGKGDIVSSMSVSQ